MSGGRARRRQERNRLSADHVHFRAPIRRVAPLERRSGDRVGRGGGGGGTGRCLSHDEITIFGDSVVNVRRARMRACADVRRQRFKAPRRAPARPRALRCIYIAGNNTRDVYRFAVQT